MQTLDHRLTDEVQRAVAYLRARETRVPEFALVLGSGLGGLAEAAEAPGIFSTTEIPGYPRSTVEGHQGRLVFGRLEDRDVVFVQGRLHLYEGYPVRTATFPIRLVHALGARKLLVTNAAGGINRTFHPGTLMFIEDQINLAFTSPLAGTSLYGADPDGADPDGADPRGGGRPPGLRLRTRAVPWLYDPAWIDRAEAVALREGIATRRGVYLWTSGPSYETRAEIRMFERIGADAVGMSTVPEVIQARHLGMQVLGISTITNPAAGLSPEPLSHEEVLEVGQRMRGELERLLRGIIRGEPAAAAGSPR